jgi:acyl dehydratase
LEQSLPRPMRERASVERVRRGRGGLRPARASMLGMSSRAADRPTLFLEDFAPGQRFTTATVEVTADEIKAFAARFDPQPFHLDEEAAKRSLFGALAASGWHTAAMTMRLLVDSPLHPSDGMIGLGGEITWPRPTYAGDVLRVESEVIETKRSRSNPRRGVVTMRQETKNQRGEPVQIAVVKILVPTRG